jgi:adenosylcobinamide-GDP ribazoletransferase
MNLIDRFFTTVACVTCLPFGHSGEDVKMDGLAKYLPSVGLLVGGLLVAASLTLDNLSVSPAVASILLAVLWLFLSGGIHFDGLMDTADGISSHRSRDRMLEIMRDSRVGNFGVMFGVCTLLLKVAGLIEIGHALPALLLIPAWARWNEAFAIGFFPYAREEGMGKVWHDTMRFPDDMLLATIAPIGATLFSALMFGLAPTLWITGATILVGVLTSFYLSSIIRGHTGDTYGAVVEVSEAGALLLLCFIHL